jgi:hypothetical protein
VVGPAGFVVVIAVIGGSFAGSKGSISSMADHVFGFIWVMFQTILYLALVGLFIYLTVTSGETELTSQ